MALNELFEELTSELGKETHVSDWLTVDQRMINQFADVTRDHQWIHVDESKASKESPFGTTVAHGFLTLSLIPHLTDAVNPDKPADPAMKLAVNYGLNRVRFPNPVVANSKLRTRKKLIGVDKVSDDCLQLVQEVTIEIEGQQKPGCVAEVVSRYYF